MNNNRNLEGEPLRRLLALYVELEDESMRRDVMRKRGEFVGGYTEVLVCRALGLEREANETPGYDATDPNNGARYQIKGRRDRGNRVAFGRVGQIEP